MRRAVAVACISGVALLSACSQPQTAEPAPEASASTTPAAVETPTPTPEATPAAETPTPAAESATPAASGSATPEAPQHGDTDPAKLDGALLVPAELPGWEPAESAEDHFETKADKAECLPLQNATMNKTASDMGASAAYSRDDLVVQEYLDLVDSGAKNVDELNDLVGKCATYQIDDDGEKTEIRVEKFDAASVGGEKQLGIKQTAMADGHPVEFYFVFSAHKDVLMTMAVQGDKPQQQFAVDTAKQAMEKLSKI